jgi:hypothetical protein
LSIFGFQVAQRSGVEAAADVAGVLQLAAFVVSTQQQRAETAARALRIGIAADDEFLPLAAFEFDPRAACGAL